MLYSNWKLVVVIIMKMVGLVVMNNSEPLLWVVRGGWVKNVSEIFNHWNVFAGLVNGCSRVSCRRGELEIFTHWNGLQD